MADKNPINIDMNYRNSSECTLIINDNTGDVLFAKRNAAQDKADEYSFTCSGFHNRSNHETMADIILQSAVGDNLHDLVTLGSIIPFPSLPVIEERDYGIEHGDIPCVSSAVVVLISDSEANVMANRDLAGTRFTEYTMVQPDDLPDYINQVPVAHKDQLYYINRYYSAVQQHGVDKVLALFKMTQELFPAQAVTL